jgi:hypothetical protein
MRVPSEGRGFNNRRLGVKLEASALVSFLSSTFLNTEGGGGGGGGGRGGKGGVTLDVLSVFGNVCGGGGGGGGGGAGGGAIICLTSGTELVENLVLGGVRRERAAGGSGTAATSPGVESIATSFSAPPILGRLRREAAPAGLLPPLQGDSTEC